MIRSNKRRGELTGSDSSSTQPSHSSISAGVRGRSASSNRLSGRLIDSLAASAALRLGFRRGSLKLPVDAVSVDASRVMTTAVGTVCRDDRRRGFAGAALSPIFDSPLLKLLGIIEDILVDIKMER